MAESRQVNLAKANLVKAHGAKRLRIDLETEVDQLKAEVSQLKAAYAVQAGTFFDQ